MEKQLIKNNKKTFQQFFKLFLSLNLLSLSFLGSPKLINVQIYTQAASTGNLLGFEQSLDSSSGAPLTTTNLVSVDQTTGAVTNIGSPLENTLPGRNSFQPGFATVDSVGHRMFYYNTNSNFDTGITQNYVIVQDTQTGAILQQLPVDNNFGTSMEYETFPTNTSPIINPLSNTTINKGSTYATSGAFTDSGSTSWTATVDYGDGSGSHALLLSGMNFSLSHAYNALGTYTVTVKVTDNQGLTGTATAVITVIPVNGLLGANLSHTNYTGASFVGQNLSKANMSVATFNNVDFQNANLSQVNGSNSSFIQSNFTGANLNKVDFSNSNLSGANFTNAILTQGNLSNTNLTNANFTGATGLGSANLSGATWSNTTCPDGTNSNNNGKTCVGHF